MRHLLLSLLMLCGCAHAWAGSEVFKPEDNPDDSQVWQRLRHSLFGERPIQAATPQLLTFKVPARALDSAFVPVQIVAGPAAGSVRTLYLIADANPSPLAAKVQFLGLGMPINLETRIRIDAYTHLRVVAETTDGQLFMSTGFTKATGGCTAPATIDAQAALARMGQMNIKVDNYTGLRRVRWRLEHPNHSGLVMEQLTRLNIPAHYVQNVEVQFNGEAVLRAEVDFSISENPSLQFTLPGSDSGLLQVVAQDSQGLRFEGTHTVTTTSLHRLADGVYAVLGDAAHQGGNAGFIVGPQGVMVIDSGSSWREGQTLLDTVRSITALPIRLLLLTHARAEFIFGAGAFQDQGIPVFMHPEAAQLMAARCATCLQQLQQSRGEQAMRHTRVPHAVALIHASQTLQHTGRLVRVLAAGHSSSPGALAVLDEQSGVVFAGAWLEMQQLPDLRDAKLAPWLAALAPWLQDDERPWVPAHGPVVTGREGLQMQGYLQSLQACVQDHVDQGTSLIEMDRQCGQPAYAHWQQYDSLHPRNVVRLYLQLEREALLASEPARH